MVQSTMYILGSKLGYRSTFYWNGDHDRSGDLFLRLPMSNFHNVIAECDKYVA